MRHGVAAVLLASLLLVPHAVRAMQTPGGSVAGTVLDTSGAAVAGASVQLVDSIGHVQETTVSDAKGQFAFANVPEHTYQLTVQAQGFANAEQPVQVRAAASVTAVVTLSISSIVQTVDVEANASNMVETDASAHTDIDSALIDRMPVPQSSTGLSTLITLASPGVAADSNGMFHPMGEHSDTTYSIDGQPVSDQQSKTFSNQMGTSAIASVEVLDGVIPPEYGDKASLVAKTTTKSGLDSHGVHGSLTGSYGSFGSPSVGLTLSAGSDSVGNFLAVDGMRSGRFLDSPEFRPLHDRGNSEDVFDRIDWHPDEKDSLQLNLSAARSWFQQPNQMDQPQQDQRQQNRSFNVSPMWTRTLNDATVLNMNAYVRQDRVGYFPSANPFADTPATLQQSRRLTNAGIKADLNYVRGIHAFKAGANFYHTFLSEQFQTGLTAPGYNSPCVDSNGVPVADSSLTATSQCSSAGYAVNSGYLPGLAAFDLTRGGALFQFRGRTDIKQEAAYLEDTIAWRQWSILLGGRADNYNGLSSRSMLQPRLGVTYDNRPTATVLRIGYSKLFPTPYNENLILSSSTGAGGLAASGGAYGQHALKPGKRNQFNAGLEQGVGKWLVLSADYFWKYTQRDFDFDVIFNTPLTFPIQWAKSKIDGFDARLTFPQHHGLEGYVVLGHTRARFFGPEVGGILFNSPLSTGAFRIDHDQAFEQTTHVQYQPKKSAPWAALTWRFDSGEVAGAVPDYQTALGFTPDQQAQIELYCGSQVATISNPIRSCSSPQQGARLVRIPAPGTENDDKNPARIAGRNLLDASLGWDNVARRLVPGDRVKMNVSVSATNLTDKVALYNFLSTFSGTHYVPPRSLTASVALNF
ncbi:MAG: TonB-dependent receptor [Acidobacteriota bacterium]|nr:TonB-dependent receptor [Acidobacteriota bacterium]